MVDRPMADAMITCSIAFSPAQGKLKHTNLAVCRNRKVKPCRILGAPAALECRLMNTIECPHRSIILGEVVHLWVKEECINKDTLYVNSQAYRPLARLHGDYYLVAENLFELRQPTYEECLEQKKGKAP